MNFDLTHEQNLLRQTVREFANREIAPQASDLDEAERFSPELTRRMGEVELFGMLVSKEYGGSDIGHVAYCIAIEEIARVDASQAATVAVGNSVGIGPIYNFGTLEQKSRWLPELCKGHKLAAFGLTEPNAGSDAGATKTRAELRGDRWIINGNKIFITNSASEMTSVIIVQAVTGLRPDGKKELSCILVPADSPGLTRKPMKGKMVWRATDKGELYFEDCSVPRENILGKRGSGFSQMLATLDNGRLSIAAMGLGGAQGCFDRALEYAKRRCQFGRPIASFQVNAFKLADMAMEIELARNMLYKAAWLREQNRPFTLEAAMAKLFCSEVMHRCADAAVQLHGGYGLMREYEVERFYRDQKLLEIAEGTSEVQRIIISRLIGVERLKD